MTPGVEELLEHYPGLIERCLAAYLHGDRGAASEANLDDRAVASGEGRILAAYAIDPARPSAGYGDNTVWIITEADRSVTTLLLPHEYGPGQGRGGFGPFGRPSSARYVSPCGSRTPQG